MIFLNPLPAPARTVHLLGATLVVVGALSYAAPASARGGPPNIMDSAGYQRALHDERKMYQTAEPATPVVTPRHRRHRQQH